MDTRPYAERLLEPADRLRRLCHQMREVGVGTACCRARSLHEIVAGDDRAAGFAGQRFQPACRIHGGTDDGEFEPVQPDVSEDDLAVMQSDADPDRRLAAMPALAGQIVDPTPHCLRAAKTTS